MSSTNLTIFYKIQVSECNSNLYNDCYDFCSKWVYKVFGFIMTFPNTVLSSTPFSSSPAHSFVPPSLASSLLLGIYMDPLTPSLHPLKSFFSCGALSSLMTIPFMSWLRQSPRSGPAVHSAQSWLWAAAFQAAFVDRLPCEGMHGVECGCCVFRVKVSVNFLDATQVRTARNTSDLLRVWFLIIFLPIIVFRSLLVFPNFSSSSIN